MNESIQALKDVWATLIALGWQPMPSVIAVILMLSLRAYFEPDVLHVNSEAERRRLGWIKLSIFAGVFIGSGFLHVGMARPANAFDWCLSVGFCLGHTGAGYLIANSAVMRRIIKGFMGKSAALQEPPK
jgi:hypothetical protein